MTTHGAPTNEENSSRVYVHSWLSATHASSNKARLFIKRTNSILPLLVNEVIFESDFGDPVEKRIEKCRPTPPASGSEHRSLHRQYCQRKRAKRKWLLILYASQKFNIVRRMSHLQEVNPVGKSPAYDLEV
ncbi:PREDICTED: uncharacterized protein LOC108768294 isoform X1 [Trachymyrmex cornetzi]|uniref:uncharacterized protein LOC108768294 isoform X1 n=1 Tax=Trachymyrmex cornetzi TaxID=471704 RepID=UPI00084F6217|nr:PREDICTED: uncharacterized protein LOC108768294 isoform X1 [Trachymyrmex cornetzi]